MKKALASSLFILALSVIVPAQSHRQQRENLRGLIGIMVSVEAQNYNGAYENIVKSWAEDGLRRAGIKVYRQPYEHVGQLTISISTKQGTDGAWIYNVSLSVCEFAQLDRYGKSDTDSAVITWETGYYGYGSDSHVDRRIAETEHNLLNQFIDDYRHVN